MSKSKSTIIINGIKYEGDGLIIKNGKVSVDNKELVLHEKEIHINVLGDIEKLRIDHCEDISIMGNVKELKNGSGKVKCDDVQILESSSGNIDCRQIFGDVKTGSGDVRAKSINGKVKTGSGDVKYLNGGRDAVG